MTDSMNAKALSAIPKRGTFSWTGCPDQTGECPYCCEDAVDISLCEECGAFWDYEAQQWFPRMHGQANARIREELAVDAANDVARGK